MIAATPIRERLLEIEANARLLAELRTTPVEAFLREPKIYKLAERIAPMAGLRNLLVHGYLAIDRRTLHTHLSRVEDFREFIRHIEAYLAASP